MQRKAKSLYANTRSVMLNVRVTPALKARLEQMAREDHRTVSNLVELILERACDAERKR
jgi:predicted transcriptional regulator